MLCGSSTTFLLLTILALNNTLLLSDCPLCSLDVASASATAASKAPAGYGSPELATSPLASSPNPRREWPGISVMEAEAGQMDSATVGDRSRGSADGTMVSPATPYCFIPGGLSIPLTDCVFYSLQTCDLSHNHSNAIPRLLQQMLHKEVALSAIQNAALCDQVSTKYIRGGGC